MTTPSEFEQIDQMMSKRALKRSRRNWRFVAFAALVIAVVAILGRSLGGFSTPGANEGPHIARIVIDGVIASDPLRRQVLNDLANDDNVTGVVIQINSPGGTTAGGEELYEGVRAIAENKPVAAVINELGASAAYMTAIGADKVYARRLSIVGSIGVLIQHMDASKLLDTIGIDYDKVATGPLKAEPDIDEPMSPLVRQSYQQLVDDSFEWFVDIVAERRGLDRAEVLRLSDGRIMTGRMALKAQLIDEIGDELTAKAWMEGEAEAADQQVLTYYPLPEEPWQNIGNWVGTQIGSVFVNRLNNTQVLDGLVSVWQPIE
ncbi:signal peptide peptidase SppA [Maritalea sp. S77]|uniref:signal peptide peptidase SppA n=1 Tax=Maritalea sp. S77 TaxID=3415125 RepID=UPI003C7B6FF6